MVKLTQLHNLSPRMLQEGLLEMNRRSFALCLSGVLLFIGVYYFAPVNLMGSAVFAFCLIGRFVVMAIILIMKKFGPRFIGKERGILVWRTLFLLNSSSFGLLAAIGIRYLVITLPTGIYSLTMPAMLLWGCAVALSVFSFDFVALASYVLCTLLPMIYTAAFQMEGAQGIAVTYCAFIMFFLILGRASHKAQIKVLVQEATIRKQGEELLKTNDALTFSNTLFNDTLESIDEIFLLIDLEGTCYGNPSSRGASVLRLDPIGKNFTDIIRLDEQLADSAKDWFKLLASDRMEFKAVSLRGPNQWVDSEKKLSFRVRYFPKRTAGKLTGVIMTLADVTSVLRTERIAEEAEVRSNLILSASEARAVFGDFLLQATDFFKKMQQWDGVDLKKLRMELHTFKGTAAMFHVRALARDIDILEKEIKLLPQGDQRAVEIVRSAAKQISISFQEWTIKEAKTLKRLRVFAPEEISFTVPHADLVRRHYLSSPPMVSMFDQILGQLKAQSLEGSLASYESHVNSVARKLAKTVRFELEPMSEHILMVTDHYPQVVKSLVHLFNNAIDHGIEIANERVAKGKPEYGTIKVSASRANDVLIIRVTDDGGGIDPNTLRAALKAKGFDLSNASDNQVLRTIFDAGFSTRQNATEISGHGIGLSALYEQVVKNGGSVDVSSKVSIGSEFLIKLPVVSSKMLFLAKEKADLSRANKVS